MFGWPDDNRWLVYDVGQGVIMTKTILNPHVIEVDDANDMLCSPRCDGYNSSGYCHLCGQYLHDGWRCKACLSGEAVYENIKPMMGD